MAVKRLVRIQAELVRVVAALLAPVAVVAVLLIREEVTLREVATATPAVEVMHRQLHLDLPSVFQQDVKRVE